MDLSLESNGWLNDPGKRLGIDLEHEEKGSLTTHSNLICIQNIRAEFMNLVPTLFLERAFLCQCFFLPRKVWPPKILRPGKQDVVPISESVNCQFQGNKNSFSEVRSATFHSGRVVSYTLGAGKRSSGKRILSRQKSPFRINLTQANLALECPRAESRVAKSGKWPAHVFGRNSVFRGTCGSHWFLVLCGNWP